MTALLDTALLDTDLLDTDLLDLPTTPTTSRGPRRTQAPVTWLTPPQAAPATAPRLQPARMAPPRDLAPRPAAPPTAGVRPLRLTRRARLLVTVSVLAALLLLTGVAAVNARPTAGTAGGAGTVATVVVAPGDTLWKVAVQAAPDRDPAEVVRELRILNDLGSAPLQPGQVLSVPGR